MGLVTASVAPCKAQLQISNVHLATVNSTWTGSDTEEVKMSNSYNALDPTAPRYVKDDTGAYWELQIRANGLRFYSIQDFYHHTKKIVSGYYSWTGRRN